MALQSGARCWLLKVGNARVNVETRGFFTVRSCDVRGDMRARALSTGGQRAFLDRGASVAISRTAASPRSKSSRAHVRFAAIGAGERVVAEAVMLTSSVMLWK